ncbi:MAG: NTP transferase domain-containing protein [Bacteroidales bacterium]
MNDLNTKVTGIIMADGASSRMGTNKANAQLGSETLLDRAVNLMEPVCDKLIINTTNDLQMASANVSPLFQNMVLISGNGRNVGKTTFACRIIKHLSQKHEVTGIKISSHFHPVDDKHEIFAQTSDYIIVKELVESRKDSSLMLQAGAKDVYFIMSKKETTGEAFMHIAGKLAKHPIVCESGGLGNSVHPGLYLFVNKANRPVEKPWLLKGTAIVVTNQDFRFDFDVSQIGFRNNQIILKNLFYGKV